jgi:CHAT domain-containing protein
MLQDPSIGWLLAGSSAVLQSAWYVESECKTVFFSKFYDNITTQGLDVAQVTSAHHHVGALYP